MAQAGQTRTDTATRRGVIKGLAAMAGSLAPAMIGAPAIAQSRAARIGVLLPITGGLDDQAVQMRLGVEAALAAVNAQGGVLGRTLEAAYRDSEGTPRNLEASCRELAVEERASAVVGPFIAAGRKFATRALAPLGVPLVSATNNEGAFCAPGFFSLGPTPNQDAFALVNHLDGGAGRSYFFVGSYSSWQHSMFRRTALRVGYHHGGTLLGWALTDIGEERFEPVVRWIADTGAEVVLFCVPRRAGAAFVRQARALGLLDRVTVGWIGFNEIHLQHLAAEEAASVVTASTFVSADREGGVPEFVARIRALAGLAPVTYYAYSHYHAVVALAEAWRRTGEIGPQAAKAGLSGLRFGTATGPAEIDAQSHHTTFNVVIARGAGDRLEIVERLGPVAPEPGCGI
jgi:ABC-type branched-subunit amino acid transport system substrate-binding protein